MLVVLKNMVEVDPSTQMPENLSKLPFLGRMIEAYKDYYCTEELTKEGLPLSLPLLLGHNFSSPHSENVRLGLSTRMLGSLTELFEFANVDHINMFTYQDLYDVADYYYSNSEYVKSFLWLVLDDMTEGSQISKSGLIFVSLFQKADQFFFLSFIYELPLILSLFIRNRGVSCVLHQ